MKLQIPKESHTKRSKDLAKAQYAKYVRNHRMLRKCIGCYACRMNALWTPRIQITAEVKSGTDMVFIILDLYAKYYRSSLRTNIGFVRLDLYPKYCRNGIENEHRVCKLLPIHEILQKTHCAPTDWHSKYYRHRIENEHRVCNLRLLLQMSTEIGTEAWVRLVVRSCDRHIGWSVRPSVRPIRLSARPSIRPSVCPTVHTSVLSDIYIYIYLYIYI